MLVNHYVDTPLKRALWVGYAVFWLSLLIYIRIIKPFIMLRHPYIVEKVIGERGNAWTLVVTPDGHNGFRFMPGQFAWLTVGQSPLSDAEHPFSISSSAADPRLLTFTIKALGDFTSTIKDLVSGQRVYIDGPFGAFSIDRHPQSERFAFIAGGIGITPMLSMLNTIMENQPQREVTFIHATVSSQTYAFKDHVSQLEKEHTNLKSVICYSSPTEDDRTSGHFDKEGFVDVSVLQANLPSKEADFYFCGPIPFMQVINKALKKLEIPNEQIHFEVFSPIAILDE